MKRFVFLIIVLCTGVISLAFADTITVDWLVDSSIYSTSTCTVGNNLTLPSAPTKRGHHFVGWKTFPYVFLEYIESTSTQYIDTDYIFTTNNGVLDIEFAKIGSNSSDNQGCGSYSLEDLRCFGIWFNKSTPYIQVGRNNLPLPTAMNNGEVHHLIVSVNNGQADVILDGSTVINTPYTGTIVNGKPWYLFAMNHHGNVYRPSSLQIHTVKLYEKDTLVRNLIPVKRTTDQVIGMYDTVSDTFFENAGTGTFIAGPEL